MKFKQFCSTFLACALTLCCVTGPVSAIEAPDEDLPILRVSERIDQSISANSIAAMEEWFSLDKGDTVSFDCTYTPKSASVDFGIVDSNNIFHYVNYTSGSVSKSIRVTEAGQYKLAIRNNESYSITVTGT